MPMNVPLMVTEAVDLFANFHFYLALIEAGIECGEIEAARPFDDHTIITQYTVGNASAALTVGDFRALRKLESNLMILLEEHARVARTPCPPPSPPQ